MSARPPTLPQPGCVWKKSRRAALRRALPLLIGDTKASAASRGDALEVFRSEVMKIEQITDELPLLSAMTYQTSAQKPDVPNPLPRNLAAPI